MKQPLENVREKLLRAGVPPRHARRYVAELNEHLADLTEQESVSGHAPAQAEERARKLLGTDMQLAEAMIQRGGSRSLTARAPWALFTVGPIALLLAVTFATAISMMYLLSPIRSLAPADIPLGYSGLIAAVSFVTSYLVGPLLAAGCMAMALRQRLNSRWVWVGLGLIALLSAPLGFHMHVVPSEGGGSSAIYSATGIVYLGGRPDMAATVILAALRAAVLFAMSAIVYRTLQRRLVLVRE